MESCQLILIISINNSSVVTQEVKPGLVSNGFTVIDSYFNEFDLKERKILDYWDLPRLLDKNLVIGYTCGCSEK